MITSKAIRAQLIDALQLDLIGPRSGAAADGRYAEEVLPVAPSKWYLAGFLVPYEARPSQRSDDDGDRIAPLCERRTSATSTTARVGQLSLCERPPARLPGRHRHAED